MAQKNRTRPGEGRVGCEKLSGASHLINTATPHQIQRLITIHAVRPSLAGLVAALAYGEARHG